MPIRKVPLFTPEELKEMEREDRIGEHTSYKLTADDVKEIAALAKAGRSVNDIASRFEVDKTTIRYHLKKAGIKPNNLHRSVTDEQIEQMIALHKEGWTIGAISAKMGVTQNQVYWYCVAKKKAALKNSATNEKNHF